MMGIERDLGGIYVTDDGVDAIVGSDITPRSSERKLSTLKFECDLRLTKNDDFRSFRFSNYKNVEDCFGSVTSWISSRAPRVRSIGVAGFGPFKSLDLNLRDSGHPDYGCLAATSHGKQLSGKSLYGLINNGFIRSRPPSVVVNTDVAAAVIGEVYNRSLGPGDTRSEKADNDAIVFVKISLGVGGAFMRGTSPWHGRHHPEMGQMNVPSWKSPLDKTRRDVKWQWREAVNPESVEGRASVGAINAKYAPLNFEDLRKMPTHEAWHREAWYLAQFAWSLTCTIAPNCIVFGGRIMSVPGLIDLVRTTFREKLSKGFPSYSSLKDVDHYLVGDSERHATGPGRPGIVGALCMAAMADRPVSV